MEKEQIGKELDELEDELKKAWENVKALNPVRAVTENQEFQTTGTPDESFNEFKKALKVFDAIMNKRENIRKRLLNG